MNERIKQVRISNDKTQLEFANSLGLTRNYIAMIEIGQREPSDRTIADICRIFNINEDWLRTGEGEMQTPISRDSALADFMGDVMKGEDADFRRRLVTALSQLDTAEWELLASVARKLADESKKEGQA